jgi:hypothetical protein
VTSSFSYPSYTDVDAVDQAFEAIVKALVTADAQFLFGAGMSKESKVPTGYDLAVELLRKFFPKTGTKPPSQERLENLAWEFPLEAIAGAVVKNLGRTRDELTEALKEIFIEPDYPLSDAHRDFITICYWTGHPIPNQVFTTNFDLLLEKAFTVERAVQVSEKNAAERKKVQQEGLIPVLHLHGTLDTGYQITEQDVYDTNFSTLKSEFRTSLYDAKAFVFVGYSMMDPDYRRVYREYRSDWESRKANSDKVTYVVSPPDDEFSYRLGKEIWKERKAVWIPLEATEFFARLKSLMGTRAEVEARKEIMNKYKIKDEGVLEDKIDTTMEILGGTRQDAIMFLLETRTLLGGAK